MVKQLFMVEQFIIFVLGSRVGDPEARMTYRPVDYVNQTRITFFDYIITGTTGLIMVI